MDADAEAIVALHDEYQSKANVNQAPQFRAGIDAIHALGYCLNVTSDPRAALVGVNVGDFNLGQNGATGNEENRLPVRVLDCAHVGLTTYVETQMHMENVKSKAQRLMLQSGPINKIIRCLYKESSPQNARNIAAQQEILDILVTSIRTSLESVDQEWKKWDNVVQDLQTRSHCQEMHIGVAQEKTKREIAANQLKLDAGLKQMEEFKSQLDDLATQRRQTETQYQESLNKGPHRSDGLIKTWLKLRSIKKEIDLTQSRYEMAQSQCIEKRQAILNIRIQELQLQASKSTMESDLVQLERIKMALAYACSQLRNVIASIKIFIMFFNRLASRVDDLQYDLKKLLDSKPHGEVDAEEDEYDLEETRQEAMESATRLRCDFYVIAFTAHTYNIISENTYIPGISYVYGLGTTISGDVDLQRRAVKDKLDTLKEQGHETVNTICGERQAEVKEELKPMIKQISASTTKHSITWLNSGSTDAKIS